MNSGVHHNNVKIKQYIDISFVYITVKHTGGLMGSPCEYGGGPT